MTTIAVDCDEVLINSMQGFSRYVKEKFGYNWLYHDYKHYRLEENKHIGLSRDQIMDMFNAYLESDYAKKTEAIPWAFEKLKELHLAWHTLHVITARWESQSAITKYQIEKNFPWLFTNIFAVWDARGNYTSKAEVCKNIGASVLIEDSMDNCLDASKDNIYSFLLERPRNVWREEHHPYVKKIQHWAEIDLGKIQ